MKNSLNFLQTYSKIIDDYSKILKLKDANSHYIVLSKKTFSNLYHHFDFIN